MRRTPPLGSCHIFRLSPSFVLFPKQISEKVKWSCFATQRDISSQSRENLFHSLAKSWVQIDLNIFLSREGSNKFGHTSGRRSKKKERKNSLYIGISLSLRMLQENWRASNRHKSCKVFLGNAADTFFVCPVNGATQVIA